MGRLQGTKTLENLMKAFAGESQARNRYTFFASKAKKEGFVQIQNFFLETAGNEKEHAEVFYKYIVASEGETGCPTIEITADFPVVLGSTYDNLVAAAGGENEEWSALYPMFAATAKLEGFDDIAETFIRIAIAEMAHEKRYLKLAENISGGKVFKREAPVQWKCGNCGYVAEGPEAPDECPACRHAKAYFELLIENY